MNKTKSDGKGWLEIFIYLVIGCVVFFMLAWQVITEAASNSASPAWANPTVKTIKQISTVTGAQTSPNLFENTDCLLATFRLPTTNTMSTGCFTQTAMGLLDSDNDDVIFNGTDESLPLTAFSPHQVLAAWPGTYSIVALDTVSTGGAYISLYKNPIAHLDDIRDPLQRLIGKRLNAAPDLPLKDKLGQKLVINSQTLAFSDGGNWMVAETLNGSFVRVNLETLEVKPFTSSFSTSGSPALLKARLSISDDGRFVAIYSKDNASFKVHDLLNCGPITPNLQPENCPSFDYLPFIQGQINGLIAIRHVRFVNDGLLSFEATSNAERIGGTYEIAPTDSIKFLIDYLALGDSYTSGEGAFDYLAGTDTPDNMCHLSIRSYPLLLTNDLFTAAGGHSVACSGAVINDISSTSDTYRGQVRDVLDFKHLKDSSSGLLNSVMTNFVPGYIAQQRFVKQYQPARVTVSIGGNDVGFGDILEQCVAPHISIHTSDNDCFNTYEDRLEVLQQIDRTFKQWKAAFLQLKAVSLDSTIYSIGYPQIADDMGNCGLNVRLSKSELEFAAELIDYINQTMEKASGEAGAHYVDISQALIGHRLCEANSQNMAVNGLTAGKDVGVLGIGLLGKESYHPSALGYKLIADAIKSKTHNLSAFTPKTTDAPKADTILKAPKSGRKITSRIPVWNIASKAPQRGKSTSVKVSGPAAGLKANSTYTVRLGGSTGQIIGSVGSNDVGDIDDTVTTPADSDTGGTTIDITGENQAGETVNVTQPVFIPADGNDSDADNTPDSLDSCPMIPNSGSDLDQDGVDDVCDSNIGQPPVAGTSNPSGNDTISSNNTEVIQASGGTGGLTLSLSSAVSSSPDVTVGKNATSAKPNTRVSPPKSKLLIAANNKPAKLSNHAGQGTAQVSAIKYPHINWLLWMPVALIAWLLLILIGLYKKDEEEPEMPAG